MTSIALSPRGRVLAALLVTALSGLSGCGGGGGGGSTLDSTPVISHLQFTPAFVRQYEGNGTAQVTGTIDYRDLGGDLATLYLLNSDGSSLTAPIEGVAGTTEGTVEGLLEVDTTQLGQFDFQLYVTDRGGRRSNTLSGVFEVRPNDTASRWTPQTFGLPAGTQSWQRRVRWAASTLVSVGSALLTSPDGVHWTPRATPTASVLRDVTWAGSQFVAVGENATVLTSPNGTTWSLQATPAPASAALHGVAWSGSRLVAVGTQTVSGNPEALIMTSIDGVAWSVVPGAIPAALNAVVWSGHQFVAVGSSLGQPNAQALALTSPDGLTWTSRPIDLTGLSVLYDIAWNGSRFVAVGYAGAATSTDGVSWQATGTGVVGPNDAIGWSGERFLTCGLVYCQVATDALQWQTAAILPGTGPLVYGLVWSGTQWVVVGTQSYVATSP